MRNPGMHVLAAALIAVGTSVAVARETTSSLDAKQALKAMDKAGGSLTDAIKAAEDKTDGQAFSVELVAQQKLKQMGTWATERNRQAQETVKGIDPQAPHAKVHCLTSGNRVQCALVDLRSGKVVRVRNAGHEYGASHARDARRDGHDGNQRGQRADVNGDYIEDNAWPPQRNDRYGNSAQDRGNERARRTTLAQGGSKLVLASDLMSANVWNDRGDELGDISDLAIDPTSACVVYATLTRGGFMGLGDKHFAIPAGEISLGREGQVFVDIKPKELENRKGFDADNWPNQANPYWASNDAPGKRDAQKQGMPQKIVKATNVIGHPVMDRVGQKLGEVEDLVVDPARGKVAYAVVALDDGITEQNYVAVPAAALTHSEDKCVVNVDAAKFKSMEKFAGDDYPNWNSKRWNRRAHGSFNVDPYWQNQNG
jgi:sporulation protein YlmC with PRC-barrel domain